MSRKSQSVARFGTLWDHEIGLVDIVVNNLSFPIQKTGRSNGTGSIKISEAHLN